MSGLLHQMSMDTILPELLVERLLSTLEIRCSNPGNCIENEKPEFAYLFKVYETSSVSLQELLLIVLIQVAGSLQDNVTDDDGKLRVKVPVKRLHSRHRRYIAPGYNCAGIQQMAALPACLSDCSSLNKNLGSFVSERLTTFLSVHSLALVCQKVIKIKI